METLQVIHATMLKIAHGALCGAHITSRVPFRCSSIFLRFCIHRHGRTQEQKASKYDLSFHHLQWRQRVHLLTSLP